MRIYPQFVGFCCGERLISFTFFFFLIFLNQEGSRACRCCGVDLPNHQSFANMQVSAMIFIPTVSCCLFVSVERGSIFGQFLPGALQ